MKKGYHPEDILFSVEFRLHTDVLHHNRSIYSFFDVLGDLGGLFDALTRLSSYVVLIFIKIFGDPMH